MKKLRQTVKQGELIRVDMLSEARFAEGWVRVHLGLEKSLAAFVKRQPVRAYGVVPDPDASDAYKSWWKALRRFDAAKESSLLLPFSDPAWAPTATIPTPGLPAV